MGNPEKRPNQRFNTNINKIEKVPKSRAACLYSICSGSDTVKYEMLEYLRKLHKVTMAIAL